MNGWQENLKFGAFGCQYFFLRKGGKDRKEREEQKEEDEEPEGSRTRYTDAKLNFFQFIPLLTSETLKLDEYLCATGAPIRSKFSLFLNWKWEVYAAGVAESTFADAEKKGNKKKARARRCIIPDRCLS